MLRVQGTIVNYDGISSGEILINTETGLIEEIGKSSLSPDLRCDPPALIFPGFGDLHVHAREDASGTQNYKEDFLTMSEAALHGGVVHVAEMPNNPVAPVDDLRYREKKKLAEKSLVDVTLYAGVGPGTKPLAVLAPYKVFMGPSIGDLFFRSKAELEETIRLYKSCNVSFHCEDPEILEKHKNEATHEARRPKEAEVAAMNFAISLIRKYDLEGKMCHISTVDAMKEVIAAKKEGTRVTSEITPHHLYFDATMLGGGRNLWLQMNPPLRNAPEERLELVKLLKRGGIDYLATDHAPHTRDEKLKGISGVPHLDTYGPFITWLMREHKFTPEEVARVSSWNPGCFVKPFLPKARGEGFGKIAPGYVGSLTVLHPELPTRIERSGLRTKCGWSPFEGVVFPGRVLYTIVRGKVYNYS